MSTRYNTGNPIESTDVRDMSDNAKNFDEFSNSMSDSFTDRFGVDRQTMEGAVRKSGFRPASFDFLTGGSLVSGDRNKAVFNPAPPGDNNWYAWQGAFPKIISPNSTPSASGGLGENAWKPVTNNVLAPTVRDSVRRSYAVAGYNLVDGSFEAGGTLVNTNDVLLHEASGKAFTGPAGTVAAGTDPTSGAFNDVSWVAPSYRYVGHETIGLIAGDPSKATQNMEILNTYRDTLIELGIGLEITSPLGTDIAIDGPFQFVRDSDLKSLRIKSTLGGGFVRVGVNSDSVAGQYVLTVGTRGNFVKGVSIKGFPALRFSATAGLDGKLPNRRGRNTSCIYLGNLYNFELEVLCAYGERAVDGKCIFRGSGFVKTEWCHEGWRLNPLSSGSAGSACTNLDFKCTFDYTIIPFNINTVVYSSFSGYAQALRQAYDHYESDEIGIFLRDEMLGKVSFDFGIEAWQGMYRYNVNTPSYVTLAIRAELGDADEDHFAADASRTYNVPLADQAYYSMIPVGTTVFDNTQFSGSTVTSPLATPTAIFNRPNQGHEILVVGGFIERGTQYNLISASTVSWPVGVDTSGARFSKDFLHPAGDFSKVNLGGGKYLIQLAPIPITADGTFTVTTPAGFGQIVLAMPRLIRNIATGANINFVSRTGSSITYVCEAGAGLSVDCQIICFKNT